MKKIIKIENLLNNNPSYTILDGYQATITTATAAIKKLESTDYILKQGEASRPDYIIVDLDTLDRINLDGCDYDWDGCDCEDKCGECEICIDYKYAEDLKTLRECAVSPDTFLNEDDRLLFVELDHNGTKRAYVCTAAEYIKYSDDIFNNDLDDHMSEFDGQFCNYYKMSDVDRAIKKYPGHKELILKALN